MHKESSLEYRPAIDGLRAVAVLSVFVFHLNHSWLPGGFVGVDVFFVISGYLITSIIFTECQRGSFSLARFYQRRIARIFPVFFMVALTTLAAGFLVYTPQDLASAGANLSAAALSAANIKLMFQGNYFVISPDAQPFLHYWSLSVEEQFYLLFPVAFLVFFKLGRKRLVPLLLVLCLGSFVAAVVATRLKPVWAFYLLPTRAWELSAGCLLAVVSDRFASGERHVPSWISSFSLALIGLAFFLIHEGSQFPGFLALLPVVGAVGVLIPVAARSTYSERWLATSALVLIGKMSYSLYLWHWPVFSIVDYRLFLSSEPVRLALKVGLSFIAAVLSYAFLERPARVYLNRSSNMRLAYAFMTCAVAFCVPLGVAVRKANYVNAEARDVAKGGLVFDSKTNGKSVILMGDSNGSMYGKVVKDICAELGYRLTVVSVAAGDPLHSSRRDSGQLWLDSLAVIQRERPDFLLLACNWDAKIGSDKERVVLAVETLKPFVGQIFILNQPPILPDSANRASIRQGARPPFFEDSEIRHRRQEVNDFLLGCRGEKCSVIDVAAHFEGTNGEVFFLDSRGRQLYADKGHLSNIGAEMVRMELVQALSRSMGGG